MTKIQKERLLFSVGDVYALDCDVVVETASKDVWLERMVVCKGTPVQVVRKSTEDESKKDNCVRLTVRCANGAEFKVATDDLGKIPIGCASFKPQIFIAQLKKNADIIGGVLCAVAVSFDAWLMWLSPPMYLWQFLILSLVAVALPICSIAFLALTAKTRGKDVLYSSQELRNELSKLLLAQCCEKAAMVE